MSGRPTPILSKAVSGASDHVGRPVHSRWMASQAGSVRAALSAPQRSLPALQLIEWIQAKARYKVSGAQGSMWLDQEVTCEKGKSIKSDSEQKQVYDL